MGRGGRAGAGGRPRTLASGQARVTSRCGRRALPHSQAATPALPTGRLPSPRGGVSAGGPVARPWEGGAGPLPPLTTQAVPAPARPLQRASGHRSAGVRGCSANCWKADLRLGSAFPTLTGRPLLTSGLSPTLVLPSLRCGRCPVPAQLPATGASPYLARAAARSPRAPSGAGPFPATGPSGWDSGGGPRAELGLTASVPELEAVGPPQTRPPSRGALV